MERDDQRLTTDDLAADPAPTAEQQVAEHNEGIPDESGAVEPSRGAESPQEPRPIGEDSPRDKEPGGASATDSASSQALFASSEAGEFRTQWETIQTGFVDEPRRAVENADALVADLMQRLAAIFSEERKSLEGQWDRGDDVSTEDLRLALQRYRSFFDRLLSA